MVLIWSLLCLETHFVKLKYLAILNYFINLLHSFAV